MHIKHMCVYSCIYINRNNGLSLGENDVVPGGVQVIFLGLKSWPKVIFWGFMKDADICLGHGKITEGFFGL